MCVCVLRVGDIRARSRLVLAARCQLISSSERRERERPRRLKEREQKVRADKPQVSLEVSFTSVSCYTQDKSNKKIFLDDKMVLG